MTMHDVFISYATEDNDFASGIAYGLKANGLSVWYAPLTLKVGNKLLDSIEKGLQLSRSGLLIVSEAYLAKGWTSYEMDILIRQHIEGSKKILPVWLGVTRQQVEQRNAGLSGIVAITHTVSIRDVVAKLVASLSDNAPSRGVVPGWEDPSHRFLDGLGEVNLQDADGPPTTIFELLVHGNDRQFPFWLAGRLYAKEELLLHVARLLGPVPDRVKNWVGEDGYAKLWEMCKAQGIDPGMFY